MKRVALVDADILCYQTAASCEVETRWDEDIHTVHSDFKVAWQVMRSKTADVLEKAKADVLVMVLSSNTNFRMDVYPKYKSNRKATRKPLCLADLKAKTKDTWESYQYPGLEGDDVLGILSTDPEFYPGCEKLIVSIDKDMKTLPGKYFDFGKDEWHDISEDEANWWHMYQTLIGDTTDGYPGCPGIGPKTAEKILADLPMGDRWKAVVAAYAKAKLSEAVALQQARCAFILQHGFYSGGEVKLWTPPAE